MNIKELYEGRLLKESYERLQGQRLPKTGDGRLITRLGGPEILSDSLTSNWLTLNYFVALGFDYEKNPIMGELGGVIPRNPEDLKRVLAVSWASISKVGYGIGKVKEAKKTGNTRIISKLEGELKMPVKTREGITIVNGNRNVAHYDFTTLVVHEDLFELLQAHPHLLLSAGGFMVMSNKCLPNEHYVFNFPINQEIFERMKELEERSGEDRLASLIDGRENVIPTDFIAGFHIAYQEEQVRVSPVVPEKSIKVYQKDLEEMGIRPVESKITSVGASDAYGNFGICSEDFFTCVGE